ncbi:hypothetical protein TIFTF001_031540 [Ficus carica]|uniref:MULE transposase domain-containing protein n=1 Tax=Ficus carica TaxID=3494 RepID=A0AA88DVG1_FICCA|nr:hypothetical protein TIFTF001_031540 [Ficus carica]
MLVDALVIPKSEKQGSSSPSPLAALPTFHHPRSSLDQVQTCGMAAICVFIKYTGQGDGTSRYVGGEIYGILVPLTATYVGLIELVRSVIGMMGLEKTIIMRYAIEPGMPSVRIQYDADVNFYIQLKKKDVHVLSKFLISIDVLDESVAEAIPPEVGKNNHIPVQPSKDGGQSDEAMQPVVVNNLIIPSPIPSLIVGMDLHMEDGLEEQVKFLNNDLGMNHDDYNAGEFNIEEAARDSNKRSITGSIGAQSVVNRTITQSVHLHATRMKDSDLFVVKRYDDVHTCSIEIVQGHHRQAKSWMIGECVNAKYLDSINTSYRPRKIMRDMQDEFEVSFNYLRAWQENEAALTSLQGNNAESYKGLEECYLLLVATTQMAPYFHSLLVSFLLKSNKSWKWFFEKLRDSIGTRESLAIVADRHKGIKYAANIVYPDADFGICVQHLAANLKMRYKDFKGPMKTYFGNASRAYLVSEH